MLLDCKHLWVFGFHDCRQDEPFLHHAQKSSFVHVIIHRLVIAIIDVSSYQVIQMWRYFTC